MSQKNDKKIARMAKKAIQQKTNQIAQSIFGNIYQMPIKARFSIAMKIIFSPIKQKLIAGVKSFVVKINPFKKKSLTGTL